MRIRREYHIYKHIAPTENSPRIWGSVGLKYLGVGARKLAIAVAKELQQNATDGTEYSVQEYIFSPRSKNRPVKTKIWRNGIDLSEIQKNKKERIEERRKEIAAA